MLDFHQHFHHHIWWDLLRRTQIAALLNHSHLHSRVRERSSIRRAPKEDRREPWWKTQDHRKEGVSGASSASGRCFLQVDQGADETCTRNDHPHRQRSRGSPILKIFVGVGLGFLLFTNQEARQITADHFSKQLHMRFLRSMIQNAAIRRIIEYNKVNYITCAKVRVQFDHIQT